MMTLQSRPEEAIFDQARERANPQERAAFVEHACRGDELLQHRVLELLAAHDTAQGPLDVPPPGLNLAQASTVERPGTLFGPYKLLQQIGEGGMGTVYMAEQAKPVQRRVALKIIKPGMDSRQVIARFAAERQALALMDHVNIARVLDAGVTELGRPYFAMELVHGVPITKYCDDNHLTPRQRIELFVPVCQAIQHAHQKGIIHRDIKPSNVMITLYDGKPVPKVIDFGVAKATEQKLTEQTLFTQYGTMVGTLEYMSPEQAEMSALGVDTRSDIYSLGVLLYELLTGSTPLSHKQMKESAYGEILRLIREEEPPKPSTRLSESRELLASIAAQRQTEPAKLAKLMRGELDWIVMKCLEKDRNRRYESASGFAADLQRYLNDEPVQACPPSAAYCIRKFVRRNRAAVVAASFVIVALVFGVIGTTCGLLRAEQQRRNAEKNERKALAATAAERQAKDDLRRDTYFHLISLAHRELSVDNLHGALKYLNECPEELRGWEWNYLVRLCRVEPLVLRYHTEVHSVAFSQDGTRLASAGGDGTITIWNSKTGAVIQTFSAHADAVVCVAFHRDGKHLASRSADRDVRVWDLAATGRPVFSEPCEPVRKFGTAYTVAFSLDGRQLVEGSDGVVNVWDWQSRQLLHSLPGHNFHSVPVAFSRDGRLATGTFRQGLKVWGSESHSLLGTIHAHSHPVSALAFSPDGAWLASASFDRTVKLSDSRTGRLLHTLSLHTGNVECTAFGSNGRRLASGGEDKIVRLWDAATGREVLRLSGHTRRCGCVAFSPDGRRLVSASADGTIRFWDATPLNGDEGQELLTFRQHTDEVRSVAFSPDAKGEQLVASSGTDGLVRVWNAQNGRVSAEFGGHRDLRGHRVAIFCLAWHPKADLIASASLDTVRVWRSRSEREAFKLPAEMGKIALPYTAVAFSPDGRHLVTGKVDGVVRIWNAESGEPVGTLDMHNSEIRGLVFSRDGKHLASASIDGIVKVWDAKELDSQFLDGKKVPRRTCRARVPGPSLNVAFSPDGQRLATGGEENTIKIWDLAKEGEPQTLRGHSGEVYALAFSSDKDGLWIASGGEDSAVKVWNSRTGKFVRNFRGHTGLVSSIAFSPDSRRLVSGSRDKTVKIWDITQLGTAEGERPVDLPRKDLP